jgi:acyl phosphate:glycerol-3-phosphate acyltransferase
MWGPDMALMAGYGAVIGHLFPVWLRFKGGKGMATTLGVLLAIDFPVGAAACVTWLVVAAVFRYSSLASLLSIALAPLYALYLPLLWRSGAESLGDRQIAVFAAILAVLVWIKHHENIRRLLSGTESKIGARKTAAASH